MHQEYKDWDARQNLMGFYVHTREKGDIPHLIREKAPANERLIQEKYNLEPRSVLNSYLYDFLEKREG